MAKRDADIESIDEYPAEPELPTVGEQLRTAREERGISLEDIAAQTRIPQRHLASIETGEWDSLPAATYTVGFAKSYAGAVGLDRTEIGNQLREEMGGQRFASSSPELFEAADPARTMPKWLVIGAIAAVILLVVVMSWLNRRSLDQPDQTSNNSVAAASAPAQPNAPTPAQSVSVAQGPVVLTAISPVWLQVSQRGGASLFSGTLQAGQTYAVPASAMAPVLKTGKPESLRITVGNAVAPPVGPPATTVTNVSLLGADLLKATAGAAALGPVAVPTAGPPAARPRKERAAPTAPPTTAAASPETTAPTNNTAQ